MKNLCNKTRKIDNPYEIWEGPNGFEWRVLKKYQADDNKPFARAFCAVRSNLTWGQFEYGDVYVKDYKTYGEQVQ